MNLFRKFYCRFIYTITTQKNFFGKQRLLHTTRVLKMSQEALSADAVTKTLRKQFTEDDGSTIEVEDISGGCGAMFSVRVESPQFIGMTRVKQQKLINEVLREQIKQMHGIRIETKAIEKK